MEPKQDTFNESVSSILERKVRGWLTGVIEDMRRSSPVQQWLDSFPTDTEVEEKPNEEQSIDTQSDENKAEEPVTENTVIEANSAEFNKDKSLDAPTQKEIWKRNSLDCEMLTSTPNSRNVKNKLQRDHSIQSEGCSPRFKNPLLRDQSLQSDASGSSSSSVLNVLGARKVDAESVLLALGFGPSEKQQKLQRIPDRFLVPSKLKGISTEQFIKDEQLSMRMHDCGIFGYRGLTEHCTPVCRFMKPVPSGFHGPYQIPDIAVQLRAKDVDVGGLLLVVALHPRKIILCLMRPYSRRNPHVPPSTIVAKIMECILQNNVCREEALMKTRHSIADMRSPPAVHAHLVRAALNRQTTN